MNFAMTRICAALTQARRLLQVIQLKPFDGSTPEGRSKERYRRIGLTTLSSALAKSVSIITALIAAPLTVHYLGTERYGLWMTIASVITILGFADLGMGNGLMNAIIEANGRGDRAAAQKHVASAFFMLTAMAIAVLVIFAVAYPLVPWARVFNVSSALAVAESGPGVAVFVVCFALSLPLGTVQRVQMGYQEGFQSNLWQSAASVLGLTCVVIAVLMRAGLPWLVLAMAGAPVAVMALNWVVQFFWSRPWLRPRWEAIEWSASRTLIATGSMFFLLQIFALIGTTSDSMVLAQIIGPRAVAVYSFAQRLFSLVLIVQFFVAPLWPAFGDALERKEYAWGRRTLLRALVLSISLTALISFPMLIFANWIITIWVGSEYIPPFSLLAALCSWVLLVSYTGVMCALLNNGPLIKKQALFFGIASIAALVLKIVLTPVVGISGVVWASVLGYGILYAVPAGLLAHSALRSKPPDVTSANA